MHLKVEMIKEIEALKWVIELIKESDSESEKNNLIQVALNDKIIFDVKLL